VYISRFTIRLAIRATDRVKLDFMLTSRFFRYYQYAICLIFLMVIIGNMFVA